MKPLASFKNLALAAAAALTLATGLATLPAPRAAVAAEPGPVAAMRIVAMRRLTEAQYRNAIADIFGPDIRVSGRFEPIVRPAHEMIARGARDAAISPSGLEQFDAMGRIVAAQVFDPAHRSAFVPCAPADAAQADAACADATLTPLGRYLFRRPLTASERAFYVKLASDAAGPTQSFYKGLELALSAMLVSPGFLYVIETAEPDPDRPGELRLDNFSRASRLSFMLWDTTPNESLLKAAEAGQLTQPATLRATASRMIAAPRFEAGVRAFFSDMLLFEKFDELAKDPLIFAYFNQQVLQALPEQTLRTLTDLLLARNADYREIFTTNRTFMTRALGPVYKVPVAASEGWVPHEFAPAEDRAGILGQAGFLAMYSHSGRSSPTLRGRAIRELLMCQPVPNPPGNVNFTAVQDTANKAMPTARIRLDAHNVDPACTGCHKITDPVGLTLERFDGIGMYRQMENGAAIDISGGMNGQSFSGGNGLGKAIAASPEATTCVTGRALEYATGWTMDEAGELVERLEQDFARDGYTIRSLFLSVATMPETWQVRTPSLETNSHLSMTSR